MTVRQNTFEKMLKFKFNAVCVFLLIILELVNSGVIESKSKSENERVENLKKLGNKINEVFGKDSNICTEFREKMCESKTRQNELYETLNEFNSNNFRNEIQENTMKELYSGQTSLANINEKVKACVLSANNSNFEEELKNVDFAKEIGGWPLYTPHWTKDKFDLALALAEFSYGFFEIFTSYDVSIECYTEDCANIDEDFSKKKFIITINPIKMDLNKEGIKKIIEHFQLTGINDEIDHVFEQIRLLQRELKLRKEIFFADKKKSDLKDYDLSVLKKEVRDFDWEKFLEKYIGKPLNSLPPFKVRLSIEVFKHNLQVYERINKKIIANYIMLIPLNIIGMIPESQHSAICIFYGTLQVKNRIQNAIEKNHDINTKVYLDVYKSINETINEQRDIIHESEINLYEEEIQQAFDLSGNQDLSGVQFVANNFPQNIFNFVKIMKDFSYLMKLGKLLDRLKKRVPFLYYNVKNLPSVVYFAQLLDSSKYKSDFVVSDLPDETLLTHIGNKFRPYYFNCSRTEVTNAFVKIPHYENVFFSYKVYENWMKRNEEIVKKENEILAEYGLDNKKLFLLLSLEVDCENNEDTIFKDLVSIILDCQQETGKKCNYFKISLENKN